MRGETSTPEIFGRSKILYIPFCYHCVCVFFFFDESPAFWSNQSCLVHTFLPLSPCTNVAREREERLGTRQESAHIPLPPPPPPPSPPRARSQRYWELVLSLANQNGGQAQGEAKESVFIADRMEPKGSDTYENFFSSLGQLITSLEPAIKRAGSVAAAEDILTHLETTDENFHRLVTNAGHFLFLISSTRQAKRSFKNDLVPHIHVQHVFLFVSGSHETMNLWHFLSPGPLS